MNILIQSVLMHLWSAYGKSFNVPYDADGRICKAFWIIQGISRYWLHQFYLQSSLWPKTQLCFRTISFTRHGLHYGCPLVAKFDSKFFFDFDLLKWLDSIKRCSIFFWTHSILIIYTYLRTPLQRKIDKRLWKTAYYIL